MQMHFSHTTDEVLWQRTKQGDEAAFAALIDRYRHLIYQLAMTSLDDHQESQEVVMDVFTSLWKSAPNINLKFSLKTYLVQCTRNKVIKYLAHKAQRRKVVLTGHTQLEHSEEIPDPDFLETILAGITNERYRRDVELVFSGASYSDIAGWTGRTIKQVYKSIAKVKVLLRTKNNR
jgi:RNA polymerase sigma-70 factor, ECF subfamily